MQTKAAAAEQTSLFRTSHLARAHRSLIVRAAEDDAAEVNGAVRATSRQSPTPRHRHRCSSHHFHRLSVTCVAAHARS